MGVSNLVIINTKDDNWHMSIRSAVEKISPARGIEYVKEYYAPGRPFYSGSHFEKLEAYNNLPDRITSSDLMAVTTLDTPIYKKATIGILIKEAAEMNALLAEIPERSLRSISEDEFATYLGSGSAALQLWDTLRRNGRNQERWNVGPTRASKIMARKRPHLIPIRDSVIDEVVGHKSKPHDWKLWWEALVEDDYLETRAEELREAIGLSDLSTLRALDVMLWMHGTNARKSQALL